jgi:hypothetical protein
VGRIVDGGEPGGVVSRYRIFESVGTRSQRVRRYADLEIHHPSYRGREPGRAYALVHGRREEVIRLRGHLMVSKDFVLQDEAGARRVPVPSPVDGVVAAVDRANGRVDVFDRRGGEPLVRLRHLDLRGSGLIAGERVGYGEWLGLQGGFGRGDPMRYGVHVHVDFNAAHLDRLDRYLRDLDAGIVTIDAPGPRLAGDATVLEPGSRGARVLALQRALATRGYADAQGRPLVADGDFGERTREALEQFQRDAGLDVDGRAGPETRRALARAIPVADATEAAVQRLRS